MAWTYRGAKGTCFDSIWFLGDSCVNVCDEGAIGCWLLCDEQLAFVSKANFVDLSDGVHLYCWHLFEINSLMQAFKF